MTILFDFEFPNDFFATFSVFAIGVFFDFGFPRRLFFNFYFDFFSDFVFFKVTFFRLPI